MVKIPVQTIKDPVHLKSQPGSSSICTELWWRLSGFQEAWEIL